MPMTASGKIAKSDLAKIADDTRHGGESLSAKLQEGSESVSHSRP
jgi:hypothetical protein